MKVQRFVLIACLVLSPYARPLSGADREFKDVVRAISEEFHTKPEHIPLLGLANTFLKVSHPAGAKHVDFAIFQNVDWRKGSGHDAVESVRFAIGRGWQPFVQMRSQSGRERQTVLVYMREIGRDVNVLIATVQSDQLLVSEVRMDEK